MPPPLFIPSSSAMRIEFDGEKWILDIEHVTTRQAREIYRFIGMPILRLFRRFGELIKSDDGSDDSDGFEDNEEIYSILICLYWLMRCQCGVREPLDEADMELLPFLTALMQAMLAAAPQDAPAAQEETVPLPPTLPGGPPSAEQPTRRATTRPRKQKAEVVSLPEPATA